MKQIATLFLLSIAVASFAQTAPQPKNDGVTSNAKSNLTNDRLGSGTPARMVTSGNMPMLPVDDGYYHVPQYMPNFPTAATIWPRVVAVECDVSQPNEWLCDGYKWHPDMGRGEYLFVMPKAKEPPKEVRVPVPVPVYVEVPPKRMKQ